MKKSVLLLVSIALFSCKKNAAETNAQNIDSINKVRTKYNDSIKALNEKNHFGDFNGSHKITFSTDGASLSGTANMEKIGRDEYKVSGTAQSGKNFVKIDGTLDRVSEKYMNFYGKISQTINGSHFERTKNTTFADEEGKGKSWRLQSKVNGDGFVDYFDIWK